MTTAHLLDPELRATLEALPIPDLSDDVLPMMRELMLGLVEPIALPAGVARHEESINGPDGDVRVLRYEPTGGGGERPAYLHFHGGGYVSGLPEGSEPMNARIADRLGAVVVSVAYRLAPEHPAPAGLHDAYAALAWMHEQADVLGIDRERIAIGGESAGGGLAAALAIHARDLGDYPICHQHLTYPMLDDRTGSDAHPGDPLVGEFVWTRPSNRYGWSSYLAGQEPASPVVPARVESYEGLPPTWLHTAALDLFRDENIAYAQNLLRAGVPTELVVVPGACHGFQMVQDGAVTRRYVADHHNALGQALGVVT